MTSPAVLDPPGPTAGTGTRRPQGRRRAEGFNWPGIAFLIGLVALWQVLVSTGAISNDYLPSPAEILVGLREIAQRGELAPAFIHTVSLVLAALGLAAAFGITVGLLVGQSDTAWAWTGGTIDVLRSLPVVAFVPVALVIFGLSGTSEVVVAAFAAVWPILMNTAGGVHDVHPRLYDVGRTLGLPRWAVFVKIAVPAAAPAITAGLRIGMTVSLLVTVVAEMVGNPAGLGYHLVRAQYALQPARMFAYILTILVIGLVLNAAVMALSRRVGGQR